mgnify:CR=1 FL=1
MANTIQFKRKSSGVPGNSGHAAGEPLYNTGDSRLWIASDSSTPNWVGAPILDEDNMSSNSNLKIATQQSIKAYVDTQVATADAFSELSDTVINTPQAGHIAIYDGTNSWDNKAVGGDMTINASGSVTIANNAITNAKMADDAVDSAEIAAGAVDNAHLAGSIANAKLTNSSVTVSGDSGSDAVSLGETLAVVGTANEVNTVVTGNQVQIGLPADVTISGNLTVSGTTVTVDAETLAVEDPLIALAKANTGSDAVDIGMYGTYASSGTKYLGMFSDQDNSHVFTFFKNNSAAPTTTVNTSNGDHVLAGIKCASVDGATIDGGAYS